MYTLSVIVIRQTFNFHFRAISRNKSRIKVVRKKLDFSPIDTIGEITLWNRVVPESDDSFQIFMHARARCFEL